MRVIIEGWRFLPHSYGVVDRALCLELLQRPGVQVLHRDVPYVHSVIRNEPATLGDPQLAARMAQVPPADAAQEADATLRLFAPLNLEPAPRGRTLVFTTAEFGMHDPQQIGRSSLPALNAQRDLALLTPSQWSRSGLIRAGADPDKVVVIPHGIDPAIFHPPEPKQREALRRQRGWEDSFIFLNVGALTANKGIVDLLRAMAALADEFPSARLVIKGLDSLYRSKACLQEYLAALSEDERRRVEPRLVYLGETLSSEQTAALYQAADAYVAPYRAEAFNLPVLEAAGCGLPVICTAGGPTDEFTDESFALRIRSDLRPALQMKDIPGAVELVPDAGHLAEQMRRLLAEPQTLARCRDSGSAFVTARFTWKHAADQLLALLGDEHAPAWRARPIGRAVAPGCGRATRPTRWRRRRRRPIGAAIALRRGGFASSCCERRRCTWKRYICSACSRSRRDRARLRWSISTRRRHCGRSRRSSTWDWEKPIANLGGWTKPGTACVWPFALMAAWPRRITRWAKS